MSQYAAQAPAALRLTAVQIATRPVVPRRLIRGCPSTQMPECANVVKESLLFIQSRPTTVFAVEMVHCPQQNVQAGIGCGVLSAESLPQGVTPAAASCELLL